MLTKRFSVASVELDIPLGMNEPYSCERDFNDRCIIDEGLIHEHLLPIYCEFICVPNNYLSWVIERDLI